MRSQLRNKQTIYYSLYYGREEILDDYGDPTGDYKDTYEKPRRIACNVSVPTAKTNYLFGIGVAYTHVLSTTDMQCPIKENSVIWYQQNTDKPYNYVVKSVRRSLNNILIAIEEVKVSGNVQYHEVI